MKARTKVLLSAVFITALAGTFTITQFTTAGGIESSKKQKTEFTDTFFLEDCDFSTTGANRFFVLQPNYQLVLTGEEGDELTITVKNETKVVNGVQTRIVEERETRDGELVEVSKNYFAICTQTNSVFYFGEDVDIYEDCSLASHDGAWLDGTGNAKAGLMMPGIVLLDSRYQQETAPGVAMDRAQIVSMSEEVNTSVGDFENVLKIKETTPLELGAVEYKYYAAGIGLIRDGDLTLKEYGNVTSNSGTIEDSSCISSTFSIQAEGTAPVKEDDGYKQDLVTVNKDVLLSMTGQYQCRASKNPSMIIENINGTITVDGTDTVLSNIKVIPPKNDAKNLKITAKADDGSSGSVSALLNLARTIDCKTPLNVAAVNGKNTMTAKINSVSYNTDKNTLQGKLLFENATNSLDPVNGTFTITQQGTSKGQTITLSISGNYTYSQAAGLTTSDITNTLSGQLTIDDIQYDLNFDKFTIGMDSRLVSYQAKIVGTTGSAKGIMYFVPAIDFEAQETQTSSSKASLTVKIGNTIFKVSNPLAQIEFS